MQSTHPNRRILRLCQGFYLLALVAAPLPAQCINQWNSLMEIPGVNGTVYASILWDPDGSGPLPPTLVVAGDFTVAGDSMASRIAAFDPVSGWTALGLGLNGTARALSVLPSGELVVGGDFSAAGGIAANRIARWSGSSWSPLGAGPSSNVYSLAVLVNGNLVAGTNRVEQWNGSSWSTLGGVFSSAFGPSASVASLLVSASGQLFAAGTFTVAGGVAANCIAVWNGSAWSALGSGLTGGGFPGAFANCLLQMPNGEVVVGGQFDSAGGTAASMVASWNGQSWSALGAGIGGVVNCLANYNGDLIVGGEFVVAGSGIARRVARWDGVAWSALAEGVVSAPSQCRCFSVAGAGLFCGGSFTAVATAAGQDLGVRNIAHWNGAAWSVVGFGITNGSAIAPPSVFAVASRASGELVIAGSFTHVGGTAANNIARWDGTSWHPLGQGVSGVTGASFGVVRALATLPNGDIVAGGEIFTASGTPVGHIARWDGSSWHALGTGMDSPVDALAVLPNGDLVAGGNFVTAGGTSVQRVARWDGTSWSAMGAGLLGSVRCLAVDGNGDLLAGGGFQSSGSTPMLRVARWNGSSWTAIGTGIINNFSGIVTSIAPLANGGIAVGGTFTVAQGSVGNRIAVWNGNSWSGLGTGVNNAVNTVVALPDGSILAGGQFSTAGGGAASRIARWNGSSWLPVAGGVDSTVRTLAMSSDGRVLVGGEFLVTGSVASACLVGLASTCPATANAIGTGCTGSAGPNVLTATTLPWIGSTFLARGTGMPSFAFVLAVTGFSTTSLPLAAILPQGGAGCVLLASPDVVDVLLPAGGVATAQLVLPNTPALVGRTFHQQMLPLEVDAQFNIMALTSTNAVSATIGAF